MSGRMGRLGAWALSCLLVLGGAQFTAAFYSSSGPVVELTPSNFESKIRSGGIWLVEFYAPWCGHCQSLKPAWEQAASALKGIVNVAAVDANEHGSLGGQYNVQGFPTIKLFYVLNGAIKSSDYNGGRSAKDIVSWALDKAKAYAFKQLGEKPPSSSGGSGGGGSCGGGGGGGGSQGGSGDSFYRGTDVVSLTDSNFREEVIDSDKLWLVEFYAPWCGHCKNLKPTWIDAAGQLSGKVKVGAIDCTVHQSACQEYGVRGYPTIKFFGSDKSSPEDYQGGRDSGSIVDFATKRWSAQQPPREVREVVDQAILETECTGFNEPGLEKAPPAKVCFIAFLPNILDSQAAGRNGYLSILKHVADKYKSRPFSYLWAEGAKQEALEKSFGVGGTGYPVLVAYSPKQQQFSVMRSAFEKDHVVSFVEALRGGYERVQSLVGDKLGEVVTQPAWDGKDGEAPAEEEFSLDDIMNEEL